MSGVFIGADVPDERNGFSGVWATFSPIMWLNGVSLKFWVDFIIKSCTLGEVRFIFLTDVENDYEAQLNQKR